MKFCDSNLFYCRCKTSYPMVFSFKTYNTKKVTNRVFCGVGCDSLGQLFALLPVVDPVAYSVDWLHLLQSL